MTQKTRLTITIVYFFVLSSLKAENKDFNPDYSFKLVENGAVLIDVRSKAEYTKGHIKGAHHIPYKQIETKQNLIEQLTAKNKDKPIVVYCQSGGQSKVAKKILKSLVILKSPIMVESTLGRKKIIKLLVAKTLRLQYL